MEKEIANTKKKEAGDFVAQADLTAYDLSSLRRVRFEFAPKDKRVNMRLPASLYEAVKRTAARAGLPYQRFIRQVLRPRFIPPNDLVTLVVFYQDCWWTSATWEQANKSDTCENAPTAEYYMYSTSEPGDMENEQSDERPQET